MIRSVSGQAFSSNETQPTHKLRSKTEGSVKSAKSQKSNHSNQSQSNHSIEFSPDQGIKLSEISGQKNNEKDSFGLDAWGEGGSSSGNNNGQGQSQGFEANGFGDVDLFGSKPF